MNQPEPSPHSMTPVLIGYFPRRPRPRSEDRRAAGLPAQVEEFCTVGHMNDGAPPQWIDLWLHNALWVYSSEALAWAAAIDTENLRRIFTEESARWNGVRGSVQRIMGNYVVRHVPPPRDSFSTTDPRFHWDLYAYRMYPVRFADGTEEPFPVDPGDFDPVEPLAEDYDRLGLDVVNRCCGNMFECSPLDCNGHYSTVTVNRHCLLDELDFAMLLARHWSGRGCDAKNAHLGAAEPGPYFVIEVLRKRRPAR